jgi:hypothetical protein
MIGKKTSEEKDDDPCTGKAGERDAKLGRGEMKRVGEISYEHGPHTDVEAQTCEDEDKAPELSVSRLSRR